MLFQEPQAHFIRFCIEFGLEDLSASFHSGNIEIVRDECGRELRDIITHEDNTAVANAIMERVRTLAADPDCVIHASIAGGRKTMGVALALAMSLFGRKQDELSHVLVNPPFESHPEFFYPPRSPRILLTGSPPRQHPVSTEKAQISLAEIPFLRLRGLLDPSLLADAASWQELIRRAQETLQPPHLEIDVLGGRADMNGSDLGLSPVNLAFLLMLARRRLRGETTFCPAEGAPDAALARDMLQAMDTLRLDGDLHQSTRRTLQGGMEKSFFERRKSAVNGAMRKALGPGPAAACLIGRQRDPDAKRYRHDLPLDAAQIIIREG